MKVGFTGTRHGMTRNQHVKVRHILRGLEVEEFHHGDCVGADAEINQTVKLWKKEARVISHPPTNKRLCAFVAADEVREAKDYLERNRNIVDETDLLIAAPFEMEAQLHGGTWYTVRYARSKGKQVYLVLPDGSEDHP